MKQILFYRLLTALALCNAGSALAQSCEHPSEWPTPFQIILPLQGTITVGADVPDGTEIYTAGHNSGSGAFIRCTGGPGRVQRENGYIGVPGEPSALPGIYKTSIPGVGIAVWYAGTNFPFDPGDYTVGTAPLRVTFNKHRQWRDGGDAALRMSAAGSPQRHDSDRSDVAWRARSGEFDPVGPFATISSCPVW
ncbi:hypothetical protein H9654_05345 [Stenotrophomonas sp. Sa5BUN4]|uniref:Peptidase S1 domain-containing protein n=1 Tax=Stenotrophomonas lacuserhaii TaxID=2760084 RepID=A0A8X8K317_9GAMM|nr:hypothetical protein [Stenotrophomonas pennii]MBD7953629.1 hypothetical protein [Stenotrophomonas pennii]